MEKLKPFTSVPNPKDPTGEPVLAIIKDIEECPDPNKFYEIVGPFTQENWDMLVRKGYTFKM